MTPLVLIATTMAGCFAGSIVPLVNTELLIFAASAAAPASLVIPLILLATIAQMAGKSCLYYAGSGLLRLPPNRFSRRIDAAVARVQTQKQASAATLFASAAVGLPPFYLVSIACGALGVSYRQFLLVGLTGRALRSCVIVVIPQVLKAAMGIGS